MIDQKQDKKDDALKQKLGKDKDKVGRKDELQKTLDSQNMGKNGLLNANKQAKISAQSGSNHSQAVQPIGSASIMAPETEIYSEFDQSGVRLGALKNAAKVEILSRQGDMLKVLVDGKVGYINAQDTDVAQQIEVKKVAPKPIGAAKVSVSALNVRSEAGLDQAIMGVLCQNDKVNVYGEKNGFLEIRVGDKVGYIKAEYTDFGDDQSQASKDSDEREQVPNELKALLEKSSLSAAEMAQVRNLIAKCPESIRGDLYQSLSKKVDCGKKSAKNLYKHREDGVNLECLASALTLLGVNNPSPEMPFETYLEQVKRDQKLPGDDTMQTLGCIANAMGVSYEALCLPGDRQLLNKNFWSEIVRHEIRQGKAVMASVNGQTVRIDAVEDRGVVMTMPEEAEECSWLGAGWQKYQGQAEQLSQGKRGILAYDALVDAKMHWVVSMS